MVIITGEYLRDLRKKFGLSQAALAKSAGISQAHIAKIEGGKVNPTLATVNSIISAIHPKETKKCRDIMVRRLRIVKPNDAAEKALVEMRKYGISQLPVASKDTMVGSVSESTLLRNFENLGGKKIRDIMDKPFPMVDENEDVGILPSLLEFHQAVIVSSKGRACGIITKLDILR